MRLIDADALKKKAAMNGHCLRPMVTAFHMCVGVKDIDNAPTIEAEPVVRCKDCKHGAKDDLDGTYQCVKDAEYDEDTNMYFGFSEWHEEDFFCSYGERRADT